jgi:hypothetical protein
MDNSIPTQLRFPSAAGFTVRAEFDGGAGDRVALPRAAPSCPCLIDQVALPHTADMNPLLDRS